MASGTVTIRPSGNSPQLGVKYSTSYNGSGSYTVSLWLAASNTYASGAYFGYRIDATLNGSTQRLKENSPSTWSENGGNGTKTWYNVPYGSTVTFGSQVAMSSNVGLSYDSPGGPTYSRSVSDITRTSAKLNVSVSANPVGYWRLHWYDVNGNWVGYSGNGATGSWSYTQTGLTPNTAYNFYTQVTNNSDGEGTGKWALGFTTSGNNPTATSLSITNVTRTSASVGINGTYDTNAYWGGWEWKYGLSTSSYGSVSTGTGSMTGLTPNTTYYVTARFKDNWGRWSGWVSTSFKTSGNAPTINSHGVQTYGQTNMTMQYSASYDTNSSLSSMRWDIYEGTTVGDGPSNPSFYNTNSITGLKPNTTYAYRLVVVENQGYRTSTVTGTFKTDYATQQIASIVSEDITETSISGTINVQNPTWLTNLTIWIYSGDTLINTITKTSGITASNKFLFEDLSPGTSYDVKARITTLSQNMTGGYTSDIASLGVMTLDSSPVHIIDSNGMDKKYKMYVMGKGNIYNAETLIWQNGYYSTGTIGQSIFDLLTQSTEINGGAAATLTHIEILPNTPYTITNNEEDVDFIIHGTDENNNLTVTGYTISPGNTYTYTGTTSTTRLYISIKSSNNPVVNYATAKFFRLNIFRTIEKTLIPKDNIVCINGKIRYIDIIQAGNTINNGSHIVALKVYDSSGNDIALNKTVTMIKGKGPLNLSRITDGDITSSDYATIEGKTSNDLETIVRVDLGRDYTDIEHIILWRYYADDRTYYDTKLYGRDATTRLTWKFQDYRMQGEYTETSNGYNASIKHEEIIGVPMIISILQEPNNSTNTITGTKITINADWVASIPPVLDSWISYRTDAILAANRGRLLKEEIGNLSELTTTAKSSLVDAINELWNDYNGSDAYTNILNSVLNAILNK